MNELIICIGQNAPEQVCWTERAADGTFSVASSICGSLREAAARGAKRIVVLVPGTEVLLAEVQLPAGRRKLALQSIPYALEENLAADVEDLHFAHGRQRSDNMVAVAVVAKDRMAAWLAMLREAGIEPDVLCPATMAAPFSGAWCSVLIDDQTALVRTDRQQGYAIERDNLATLLAAIQAGTEGEGARVRLYNCSGEQLPALDTVAGIEEVDIGQARLASMSPAARTANLLATGYDEKQVVNLLQGRYGRHAEWGKIWQKWRLPVMLLAFFLLLQTGSQVMEFYKLRSESRELGVAIVRVYRETFPKARKIVNPRAQMKHKLKLLRSPDTIAENSFLKLFDQAGPILVHTKGFKLATMRYQEGKIDIEFGETDLQTLGELKKKLVQLPGLVVDIRDASVVQDHVRARMQIRGEGK